ncbi:MAG: hypothetical protein ABH879_02090 [archaeon]
MDPYEKTLFLIYEADGLRLYARKPEEIRLIPKMPRGHRAMEQMLYAEKGQVGLHGGGEFVFDDENGLVEISLSSDCGDATIEDFLAACANEGVELPEDALIIDEAYRLRCKVLDRFR